MNKTLCAMATGGESKFKLLPVQGPTTSGALPRRMLKRGDHR